MFCGVDGGTLHMANSEQGWGAGFEKFMLTSGRQPLLDKGNNSEV